MKKKPTIGIFGGTFDPVHEGHVALAGFVLERSPVERILFLPAARPPHKRAPWAPFRHRIGMLEAAVADLPYMAVSDLEARRGGPSYTVDTLRALQREMVGHQLVFLMGADSLLELHLWHDVETILTLAHLLVVARPGCSLADCRKALSALPGEFRPMDAPGHCWQRADGARIHYLQGFTSPCSSTQIRGQLRQGEVPAGLPRPVAEYIQRHALYR